MSAPALWRRCLIGATMEKELCKLRPIPLHYHNDRQVVCERCLSQFVLTGNPLLDATNEYLYVTGQILSLVFSHLYFFSAALCSRLWKTIERAFCREQLGEYAYMTGEVLRIAAQIIGPALIAAAMCMAAIFPSLSGQKGALDSESKRKREDDLEQYEKDRETLNKPELSDGSFHNCAEVGDDDSKVRAINNVRIGVESGNDDAEKLAKMTEELIKDRQADANRAARRREIWNHWAQKDFQAGRLLADAEKETKKGNFDAADSLIREATGLIYETQDLNNQYLSI